jgi:hypothetical protein
VAKVEFHAGELFPRLEFIVTNLEIPSRAGVRFYNKRGTAEQWIKEGKQALKMTRLVGKWRNFGGAGSGFHTGWSETLCKSLHLDTNRDADSNSADFLWAKRKFQLKGHR